MGREDAFLKWAAEEDGEEEEEEERSFLSKRGTVSTQQRRQIRFRRGFVIEYVIVTQFTVAGKLS